MKNLVLVLGLLAAAPAYSSTTSAFSSPDPTHLINHVGLDEIVNPTQVAVRYINPSWGVGAGFHMVYPKYGSPYIRSNPDGKLWNNKYYK